MSTFVIVPGAWDTPATLEPLVEPLESAGHAVTIVDLPCDDAAATLEQYADAMRVALPDDLADTVLVGYSFGGFTATRIAVETLSCRSCTSRPGSGESCRAHLAVRAAPRGRPSSGAG